MKVRKAHAPPGGAPSLRMDKLLFFLRFVRSRSLGQALAESGHIRVGGRRIERASQTVAVGDIVTLPHGASVVVFELLALPARRGPASEARACYRPIDPAPTTGDPNGLEPVAGALDDVGAFAIAAPSNTKETSGAMGSPHS